MLQRRREEGLRTASGFANVLTKSEVILSVRDISGGWTRRIEVRDVKREVRREA